MSATLAPTIWDLAKDKFNSIAKRRRVPEDPEWDIPKGLAVTTTVFSALYLPINLPVFLNQPDVVSTLSVAFNIKVAVDAMWNCIRTFQAARQSTLHLADPSEPQPTLTPSESDKKSLLVAAYASASAVPNALSECDFGWAAFSTMLACTLYSTSKGPRGPGE